MNIKSIEIDELIKPFTDKLNAEVVVPGIFFRTKLIRYNHNNQSLFLATPGKK